MLFLARAFFIDNVEAGKTFRVRVRDTDLTLRNIFRILRIEYLVGQGIIPTAQRVLTVLTVPSEGKYYAKG